MAGYSTTTKTYYSTRPPTPLPPLSLPLSLPSFIFSLLPSPLPSNPALVDADTNISLSFPDLLSQTQSLASNLSQIGFSKSHVAFILSPTRLDIPVLYFALLSLGSIVSPSNPISTPHEISRQIDLTRPNFAFTIQSLAHKLPPDLPTIILDSPHFQNLLLPNHNNPRPAAVQDIEIFQSDPAAVLYSSGTTGRVKGVVLSHGNFIALVAGYYHSRSVREVPAVALFTVPLFHVFGFFMVMRAAALGETTVLMGRFEMEKMLRAIEKCRVTFMPVSPPLVVAMIKSEVAGRYDLSSLEMVGCGGAPLGKDVAERFTSRFPHVMVLQGYGLTESAGTGSSVAVDDPLVHGSVGRLGANIEAKIVDPSSGECLPPGQSGELWMRGPTIMSGYIGDNEATESTLDSEGWLKTGDLCYFDNNGLLFIKDRLKELIKYKAYQVPPAELENILQSHPEIADAAVVPYPHEEAGQIPMAFVVKQPGSNLNEEQVMEFVAKQVAPYKKVRRVSFVSSIPKSAAGKILRRELVNTVVPTSKL